MLKKGKRRKKKPDVDKLSSLEKIQLHINASKGLAGPKILPKLTDEEYLVLTSKMTALKNVKIGTNNFGAGSSTLFPAPILEYNPSYPQMPQGMPVGLPPQISSGYDIIDGNIIPVPLPSRLDAITSGNAGRLIEAPDQQYPNRPAPVGIQHHNLGRSLSGTDESAYQRNRVFRNPIYIGPDLIKTKKDLDDENTINRQRHYLEQAQAIRQANATRPPMEKPIIGRGRPVGSKAGENAIQKNKDDIVKINEAIIRQQKELNDLKDDVPKGKSRTAYNKRIDTKKKQINSSQDRLASMEAQLKANEERYGYSRGAKQKYADAETQSEAEKSTGRTFSEVGSSVSRATSSGVNPSGDSDITRDMELLKQRKAKYSRKPEGYIPTPIHTDGLERGYQDFNNQERPPNTQYSMDEFSRLSQGGPSGETKEQEHERKRRLMEGLRDKEDTDNLSGAFED